VFGPSEITQGAAGDLETVARISREMVTRYGFSTLGPLALEAEGAEVFLGRDWIMGEQRNYSRRTGDRIDAQVRSLACTALDQAIAVLRPRRELIDQLVEDLIQQETIDGEDFRAAVQAWEAEHQGLPVGSVSVLAAQTTAETDVEAAQVGV
jgi:cell division protease FtsH